MMANPRQPKRRRGLRHVALKMEGEKVISLAGDQEAIDAVLAGGDIPFSGEVMTCILCGKKRESGPDIESNWRAVQLGEGAAARRYYACADHFPPDDASREAFKAAYVVLMEKAIKLWRSRLKD